MKTKFFFFLSSILHLTSLIKIYVGNDGVQQTQTGSLSNPFWNLDVVVTNISQTLNQEFVIYLLDNINPNIISTSFALTSCNLIIQ